MSRLTLPCGLLLAAALTAACRDARDPVAPDGDGSVAPSLGKGGPPPDPDPRAAFFWAVGDAYGVQSDGRFATTIDGLAVSAYDDGQCGVRARFFVGNGGGDATLDPDVDWKGLSRQAKAACGTPRTMSFALRDVAGGPVVATDAATFANVNALWWYGADPLPATASRLGDVAFHAGAHCDFVNYGRVAGSDDALITELARGADGRRQWRVESQGGHMAYCHAQDRLYHAPFVLIVREKAPL